MEKLHSNVPAMPAGFLHLQSLESRLLAATMKDLRASWLLEVAPVASAAPQLALRRARLLVDGASCRWPFAADLSHWPLPDDQVPALLLRHVWQPGMSAAIVTEAVRVLRPGGSLISVSANPWHRQAWQELGRSALRLPSWPQFRLLHSRLGLNLSSSAMVELRGLIPGLAPVLVLLARKPAEPGRIAPLRFARNHQMPARTAALSQYRAA